MTTPTNPATFSREVIDTIRPIVEHEATRQRVLTILDPFAGPGGIHDLYVEGKILTFGIELEPEWANQHPRNEVGNALRIAYPPRHFMACVTSPCYGNRMADHHDAQERCKACNGTGWTWINGDKDDYLRAAKGDYKIEGLVLDAQLLHFIVCEKCGGEGRRHYKRNTYKHHLGRELSADSAAGLQWGPAYRDLHEQAWREVSRVVDDLFILNCKDHWRKGVEQPVTAWHVEALEAIGWKVSQDWIPVKTPGLGFGANRDLRSDNEWVVIFRR